MTEDEICRYEDLQKYTREYIHGVLAVKASKLKHILPEEGNTWKYMVNDDVRTADEKDKMKITRWKDELTRLMEKEIGGDEETLKVYERLYEEGDVLPLYMRMETIQVT